MHCRLMTVPAGIEELAGLKRLDLEGNEELTALPEGLWTLAGLEELDLNECGLMALPEGIGQLARPEKLNLNSNPAAAGRAAGGARSAAQPGGARPPRLPWARPLRLAAAEGLARAAGPPRRAGCGASCGGGRLTARVSVFPSAASGHSRSTTRTTYIRVRYRLLNLVTNESNVHPVCN